MLCNAFSEFPINLSSEASLVVKYVRTKYYRYYSFFRVIVFENEKDVFGA